MIDFSNEIFTKIANEVKAVHGKQVAVMGEYVSVPSKFPCVTIDEISNIPYKQDSGSQKYAAVVYRVQVFSNKKSGKRAEARQIFKTVSDLMYEMNLMNRTYSPTPSIYSSDVYEIQATFEGAIDKSGMIYRR